jgi:hypothetical protein
MSGTGTGFYMWCEYLVLCPDKIIIANSMGSGHEVCISGCNPDYSYGTYPPNPNNNNLYILSWR